MYYDINESLRRNEELDTPCINWPKYIGKNGYGRKYLNGKMLNAHRAIWIEANGPIDMGLVVDHICKNKKCVNLKHLRLLTQSQNIHGLELATKCQAGHLMSGQNLYIKPNKTRNCMECARLYRRTYNHKVYIPKRKA